VSTAVSLALVNGRMRTGDPRRPVADALAVAGATFALVGSSAEVRKLVGSAARVIDLRGATVQPLREGAVLRRGEPASFVVHSGNESAIERFRMEDGAILTDTFA